MERMKAARGPSLAAVAEAQLRAVGTGVLPAFTVVAALGGLTSLIAVMQWLRYSHDFDFSPLAAGPLVMLAFLFPLLVWREATPSRRDYHRSMPVPEWLHSLLRVTAGWVWLMAGLAGFLLWGSLLARVLGGRIGSASMTVTAFHNGVPMMGVPSSATGLTSWIAPFAGASIAYLLGSILALRSDHPWLWMGGVVAGCALFVGLLSAAGLDPLAQQLTTLWTGRFGLSTALIGPHFEAHFVAGRPPHVNFTPPDVLAWIGAVLLWSAIAVGGTVLALKPLRD